MKKLLITTFIAVMATVISHSVHAQTVLKNNGITVPLKKVNGQWMPSIFLPAITISAHQKNQQPPTYNLPEVVIITHKNINDLFPAIKWDQEYIASIHLTSVEIIATRKKVSMASIFDIEWLLKK
jgi:hypothetical protein